MAVSDVNQLQMVSSSTTSFNDLIDSQKELIQSQIEHLQNLVVAQCELTGVNPLSQEMAAGALSIKIGKRPRDLLNPKAMKYMQSFFSIKDATNKRESREISALFGVTATQVREFFNSQRTRVRRFVRLSGEKANRSNKCKEEQEGPLSSNPDIPSSILPLNTVAPINTEGPSCSTQDEDIPLGMNDVDKHFVENIFTLMRKEDKFSGQVKLMEWILQIQDSSVLNWFLTKGGVMILATWLGQAAMEEQTTVLHVIIKVLCHLPLHKALPAHMSAILQSVNRLRFYRSSDISNRAKVLLSKWSKLFARSQNLKKPNAVKSTSECQDEMLLKQSIGEIMESESWETKADNLDPAIKCYSGTENSRKLESSQPLKLLSSVDDSKKLVRGSSSQETRERRRVQQLEQPGQKVTGRSSQLARSLPATQGRPLSADEIQKAKLRAQFMQSKYGKPLATSDGSPKKVSNPQVSGPQSSSKSYVRTKVEEQKKPLTNEPKVASISNKMNQDVYEPAFKKIKREQISWQTPPEMRINIGWMVGTGVDSKEVEFQRNRIRREKEIIYKTIHEIPSDPKEPWDREIDYDDSLTPEIPIEQLPDADGTEIIASQSQNEVPVTSAATTSQSSNVITNGNMPEPDFELLAVLLKNPDLVFALTSAEGGGNLSSQDTMKLLDMLKSNGVSSAVSSLTGIGTKAPEQIEVSLPSPTPSSNPVTSGWEAQSSRNSFSWQPSTVYGEESHISAVIATVQPHVYSTGTVLPYPQRPVIAPAPAEPIVTETPMYQRATSATLPERARVAVPLNQTASETLQNQNNFTVSNLAQHNSLAAPLQMPNLMPTSARSQMRQPSADVPDARFSTASWRDQPNLTPNSEFHTNYNNYNAYAGGTQQALIVPPSNRNETVGDTWYDTWSPDNSPVRSQPPVWSYGQARTTNGQNYRVDRSRPQLQPRHPEFRDHARHGDRRWRDQRR
ncbi:homeobox protein LUMINIDEPENDENS isoform X3 [Daucus carota subsp. sativus]|uniref:homeobox protein LUMINIDEPENDENS isoform X3 n=1 Tax=Daucus carota subsp. sativus TaxID=79200 RepID=UPI0007EFE25C|nr:PREDICTED: homeobox protein LUMINIDEPENDENS isoform X3 [Daucus carota subsp. sativus]